MKLDEKIQLRMSRDLHKIYPDYTVDIVHENNEEQDLANLHYLKEKGFVDAALTRTITGAFVFEGASINARGINHLESLTAGAYIDESNIVTNDKRDKEPNKDDPVPVTVVNKGSNVVNLAFAILAGLVIAAVIWILKQNGILV